VALNAKIYESTLSDNRVVINVKVGKNFELVAL